MNNLLAALIFFTRLPFWRIKNVPSECFKRVVPYWPLVGWLTGGVSAFSFWMMAQVLPATLAFLLALIVRLLITGALHEDGFADFCDGFGGGTTRQRTLEIMKDSHIGTYGVIAIVGYFLVMTQMAEAWHNVSVLAGVMICADVWSKLAASQVINILPYARREEEAKAKIVYSRMTAREAVIAFISALLPILLIMPSALMPAIIFPFLTAALSIVLMKRRIGGYTGDCCGALFVLCELTFYLSALILWRLH